MFAFVKTKCINCFKRMIFNYKNPTYSTFFYHLAREYVNFYRGDQNSNMNTNGEVRFLKNIIKKGMVVFDVGANKGEYACHASQVEVGVIIHCFEPDVQMLEKITLSGVVKNNVLLSDRVGIKKFYKNITNTELSSVYDLCADIPRLYDNTEVIDLPTTTVDMYCKEHKISHIDLLKIDVEGHEFAVLEGSQNMLGLRAIDTIQFEFGYGSLHARSSLKDFFQYLHRYGYKIYKIMPHGLVPKQYTPDEEHCSYANFVAVLENSTSSIL